MTAATPRSPRPLRLEALRLFDRIGVRLMFALSLVATMTLVAAGLFYQGSVGLQERLLRLREESIEVLFAAAQLNERTQLFTAQLPLLIAGDSAKLRQDTRGHLLGALDEMRDRMIQLPDYNRYFIELTDQIRYSVELIHRTVERREALSWEAHRRRLSLYPDHLEISRRLEEVPQAVVTLSRQLHYLAALAEKIYTDTSFNELDYTFLRLESVVEELRLDPGYPALFAALGDADVALERLLSLVSRDGELFGLKNQELELRYQEGYLSRHAQRHLQQLAAQISHYTERANSRVGDEIDHAERALSNTRVATLSLSLMSLLLAAAVVWFYVRRQVVGRIERLRGEMRAIASGRLDTPVVRDGRDEISAMAVDLEHFRSTAREMEHAQRRITREIEERLDAERRLRGVEQELIQTGKLAALGQLSVAITHEINQPLAAMRNQLHSIGRRLERGELVQAGEGLGRLVGLLDRIASITHHLRGFARRTDDHSEAVSPAAAVNGALELLERRLERVRVDRVDVPALWVMAEPVRLEQVLVNLLGNALDAVAAVERPVIEIGWREGPGEDEVTLWVEDNGPGVADELGARMFDPFITTKAQGLGMGLSISYNILQDFGGSIRHCPTSSGRGARFQLSLRRARSARARAPSRTEPPFIEPLGERP